MVYLPAYSPDFNPIELWWADLKRQLRRLTLRAVDELARWCGYARLLLSRSSPLGPGTAYPSFSSTDLRVSSTPSIASSSATSANLKPALFRGSPLEPILSELAWSHVHPRVTKSVTRLLSARDVASAASHAVSNCSSIETLCVRSEKPGMRISSWQYERRTAGSDRA